MTEQISSVALPPRAERYRGIRVLEVLRKTMITPRMCRVTLGGAEIDGFGEGPNVKVLIPPAHLSVPEWPMAGPDGRAIWPAADRRPAVRTYTLRNHRAAAGEIDIDFVLHGHEGVASRWAGQAKTGDTVGIGGPGGRTVMPAERYILAADHTGLPAVSRILETLPGTARGHAVIEVPAATEIQPIVHPGFEIIWLHGGTPSLADTVAALSLPADTNVFVWAGCESSAMRTIRQHWRNAGLDRRQILAISYWRRGMSETAFHDAFNHDRDEDYYVAS